MTKPRRLLVLGLVMSASWPALAAMQSVTESAVYALSETDSRSEARQKCSDNAKRVALDRAGSLFQASLAVEQREGDGPARDQATLKTQSTVAGVVSSEVVASQLDVFGDSLRMSCEVRITYDPDQVTEKLHALVDTEGLRRQLAEQQSTIAALQQTRAATPPPGFAPPPVTPPPVTMADNRPPPVVFVPPPPVFAVPPAPGIAAPPPPVFAAVPVYRVAAAARPVFVAAPQIYYPAPPRYAVRRVWLVLRRRLH